MRRSVILALCVVLCGAMMAQATTVDVTFSGLTYGTNIYPAETYKNAIEYQRIAGTGALAGYDEIDFYLNNDTMSVGGGIWGTPSPATGGMTVLEGYWTTSGGSFRGQTSATKSWYKYLDNNAEDGSKPNTYVNLPYNGSAEWTKTVDSTGTGYAMYTSVHGAWFTSDSPILSGGSAAFNDPTNPVNTLIARVFVTTGANVTFTSTTGPLNDPKGINYGGGFAFGNGTSAAGTFTTGGAPPIPEPSTLLLVTSGLVGLLCYAWRKRR